MLGDIDLIFGIWVCNDELQIKFTFRIISCMPDGLVKKYISDIDKLVNIRVSTYIHICYMLFKGILSTTISICSIWKILHFYSSFSLNPSKSTFFHALTLSLSPKNHMLFIVSKQCACSRRVHIEGHMNRFEFLLSKIYIGYWQTCQYSRIYLYSYMLYVV
jgi:hypothetical protein